MVFHGFQPSHKHDVSWFSTLKQRLETAQQSRLFRQFAGVVEHPDRREAWPGPGGGIPEGISNWPSQKNVPSGRLTPEKIKKPPIFVDTFFCSPYLAGSRVNYSFDPENHWFEAESSILSPYLAEAMLESV